jgi:DNA-binding response OmpR family regulator
MGDKSERVLIIEDEKDMAFLISEGLKSEGYQTDIAYDGLEGLSKLKKTRPDIVILDIMLPKLDGRDVLKRAKEDPEVSDIPVIILSAKSEQWDRDIGLRLGADEYIEKPFDRIKLARQIKNILKKR